MLRVGVQALSIEQFRRDIIAFQIGEIGEFKFQLRGSGLWVIAADQPLFHTLKFCGFQPAASRQLNTGLGHIFISDGVPRGITQFKGFIEPGLLLEESDIRQSALRIFRDVFSIEPVGFLHKFRGFPRRPTRSRSLDSIAKMEAIAAKSFTDTFAFFPRASSPESNRSLAIAMRFSAICRGPGDRDSEMNWVPARSVETIRTRPGQKIRHGNTGRGGKKRVDRRSADPYAAAG